MQTFRLGTFARHSNLAALLSVEDQRGFISPSPSCPASLPEEYAGPYPSWPVSPQGA